MIFLHILVWLLGFAVGVLFTLWRITYIVEEDDADADAS